MIKFKVSKREVKNGFKNILYCRYCELAELLSYETANAYNANQYGWRNDVYFIDNQTAIVTGYDPFGNKEIPGNICKKYEEIAKRIKKNGLRDAQTGEIHHDFETIQENLRLVVNDLIKEIL